MNRTAGNVRYLIKNLNSENGSALPSVLIISTVLVLFIGGILSAFVVQNAFIQRDINQAKAIYAAEKQLYEYFYFKQHEEEQKEILNTLGSKVKTYKHGLYDVIESKSVVNNQSALLKTLVGTNADDLLNYSIVLGDTNSALTLTGKPTIIGDIQASAKGVRTDNFRGVSFTGTFTGERESPTGLFESFAEMGVSIDSLIQVFDSKLDIAVASEEQLVFTGDINSRELPVIDSQVSSIIIQGNLAIEDSVSFPDFSTLIVSDSLIISDEISGDHLIFYAEKFIELSGDAEVQGQFFSTKSIVVKDDSYLRYPSIIATHFNAPGFDSQIPIHIEGSSVIDGLVVTIHDSPIANENDDLKNIVEEGALVRGVYLNSGLTENKGKVWGTVLSRNFQFYESPTSYINWIREGEIDVSKRPAKLAIPLSIGDSSGIEILDWRLTDD